MKINLLILALAFGILFSLYLSVTSSLQTNAFRPIKQDNFIPQPFILPTTTAKNLPIPLAPAEGVAQIHEGCVHFMNGVEYCK